MAQLKTTFAGLALENPIIISSSGLTNSAEKIKKLEEAGAGAEVRFRGTNQHAGRLHAGIRFSRS